MGDPFQIAAFVTGVRNRDLKLLQKTQLCFLEPESPAAGSAPERLRADALIGFRTVGRQSLRGLACNLR